MSKELAVESRSTREAHDDVLVDEDVDAGEGQRSLPTYLAKTERSSRGW